MATAQRLRRHRDAGVAVAPHSLEALTASLVSRRPSTHQSNVSVREISAHGQRNGGNEESVSLFSRHCNSIKASINCQIKSSAASWHAHTRLIITVTRTARAPLRVPSLNPTRRQHTHQPVVHPAATHHTYRALHTATSLTPATMAFEKIFGTAPLVRADGSSVDVASLKGTPVAIYFSAHWCGPCRSFTPQLIKFYNTMKVGGRRGVVAPRVVLGCARGARVLGACRGCIRETGLRCRASRCRLCLGCSCCGWPHHPGSHWAARCM